MATYSYPLHRRTMSWMQRNGHAAGVVGGVGVLLVGAMVAVGTARDSSSAAGVVAAAVGVVGAVAVYFLGRRLSAFTAAKGMLVIQPDRLEISDGATLHETLLLLRHKILHVNQPGVADTGPVQAIRDAARRSELAIGPESPNVEIWLAEPVRVSLVAGRSAEVRVVRMQTPGALALLTWFRSQPMAHKERSLIEDIVGADIDPMSNLPPSLDKGNQF